ncbi:uncharacterized protein BP01DRAFT_352731 [Aspergillus saccharolyticus JOP 1030-1]|uniref:Uncharacterized protein n=1 Tax=Aspergillus saccharolyticus JOP 1030-1 TaxID=1450539 RepID=A0A318ZRI3_9EURO|nr:hypothetical protein BP01DRAFT_352731 [Aspergillus saccharolyticus JOP 1030-1]PYH49204.1 hypothetical protein BP01DRAFT_352731 [Aspergillus saccharolyticus JOP 1030-1]
MMKIPSLRFNLNLRRPSHARLHAVFNIGHRRTQCSKPPGGWPAQPSFMLSSVIKKLM